MRFVKEEFGTEITEGEAREMASRLIAISN